MQRLINLLSATLLFVGASCTPKEKDVKAEKETPTPIKTLSLAEMQERGKYLVNAMGCDDCHSPKRMGEHGPEIIEELRLSGYPANRPLQKVDEKNLSLGWALFNGDLTTAIGPWGQSFAANLTNDPTGIANWEEENFMTAMKKGKFKGMEAGRDLLPPMPWFNYKNLSDEDLKSIFAFLKTTKPVNNVVPSPIPPKTH